MNLHSIITPKLLTEAMIREFIDWDITIDNPEETETTVRITPEGITYNWLEWQEHPETGEETLQDTRESFCWKWAHNNASHAISRAHGRRSIRESNLSQLKLAVERFHTLPWQTEPCPPTAFCNTIGIAHNSLHGAEPPLYVLTAWLDVLREEEPPTWTQLCEYNGGEPGRMIRDYINPQYSYYAFPDHPTCSALWRHFNP